MTLQVPQEREEFLAYPSINTLLKKDSLFRGITQCVSLIAWLCVRMICEDLQFSTKTISTHKTTPDA
jgi:hypothetical protein